jgi:hypothetical protein
MLMSPSFQGHEMRPPAKAEVRGRVLLLKSTLADDAREGAVRHACRKSLSSWHQLVANEAFWRIRHGSSLEWDENVSSWIITRVWGECLRCWLHTFDPLLRDGLFCAKLFCVICLCGVMCVWGKKKGSCFKDRYFSERYNHALAEQLAKPTLPVAEYLLSGEEGWGGALQVSSHNFALRHDRNQSEKTSLLSHPYR